MKRVLFTEEDFKTLISGGIVKQNGVEIALQDIGYHNMIEIIENQKLESVIKNVNNYKLKK